MMSYFEILFKKNSLTLELDSPIILQETAIIKDTVDDKILLRNIFSNVGTQAIVAIVIKGYLKDVFGEPIKYNGQNEFSYIYQDIKFEPNTYFGNKISIDLPEYVRKVEISIDKVVLLDGTVWKSNPDKIVTIQPQHEIEASDEFIKSYDTNSILPVFYFVENDRCWQCTCGQVNYSDDEYCKKCSRIKGEVKTKYSKEYITEQYQLYVAQKQREKEEENKRKEQEQQELMKKYELEQNSNSNKSLFSKYIFIIIIAVLILGALFGIAFFVRNIPDVEQDITETESSTIEVIIEADAEAETVIKATEETRESEMEEITEVITEESQEQLIAETKRELAPYVEMVGKETTNDSITVTDNFLDHMDDVKIMDIEGTISHGLNATSGNKIAMMDWVSNMSETEEVFDKLVEFLNIYYDWEGNSQEFATSDIDATGVVWNDSQNDCWVIGWYKYKNIYMRWYDKENWNYIPPS